jgi:hypothetical protein
VRFARSFEASFLFPDFCLRLCRLRSEAALHRCRGYSWCCYWCFNHDSPVTKRSFFFPFAFLLFLLTLPSPSQAVNVAVLSVPNFELVQTVFKETRARLGEILSAFEFWDSAGHELVLHHTGAKSPFENEEEGAKPFYVLIETSGSNKDHDDEVRFPFLFPFPSALAVLTLLYATETRRTARAPPRERDRLGRCPCSGRDSAAIALVVARVDT